MTRQLDQLRDLFMSLFDNAKLEVFLNSLAPDLYGQFPGRDNVPLDMCFQAANVLRQNGFVDEGLFSRLVAERPRRRQDILKVAEFYLGPQAARRAVPSPEVTFTWLHLSDLHVGQRGESSLWPDMEGALLDDLREVREVTGDWDVVLFTGDLVQQGSAAEFERLNRILQELWAFFGQFGSSPPLVHLPGNHDLAWRDPKDPAVQELLDLHARPELLAAFWQDAGSRHRRIVAEALETYRAWRESNPFPRLAGSIEGWLPGDSSAYLEKGSTHLGIVTLNSTALQLAHSENVPHPVDTGEPFKGRMSLSSAQFHAACGGDGQRWRRHEVEAALLLTHHPPDWLHPRDLAEYEASIYPPCRFVAHLFGHMHKGIIRSLGEGGGEVRRTWQGDSLCGLEHFGGHLDRRHGYSVGRLTVKGDEGRFRLWPRTACRKSNGAWGFAADPLASLKIDSGTAEVLVPIRCRS